MAHIYRFKVLQDKNIYRIIDVPSDGSLFDLAHAITNAFDFDFDHCFGFYKDFTGNVGDCDEAYELFVDQDGEGLSERAKGVKHTLLSTAFEPGKVLTFLYDYGDEWYFVVECLALEQAEVGREYPCIIEAAGEIEQYHDHHGCGGCGHHH